MRNNGRNVNKNQCSRERVRLGGGQENESCINFCPSALMKSNLTRRIDKRTVGLMVCYRREIPVLRSIRTDCTIVVFLYVLTCSLDDALANGTTDYDNFTFALKKNIKFKKSKTVVNIRGRTVNKKQICKKINLVRNNH